MEASSLFNTAASDQDALDIKRMNELRTNAGLMINPLDMKALLEFLGLEDKDPTLPPVA